MPTNGRTDGRPAQAGLEYDVAMSARNAATLRSHFFNTANADRDLRGKVASRKWDIVALQEQSDAALPAGRGSNAICRSSARRSTGSSASSMSARPRASGVAQSSGFYDAAGVYAATSARGMQGCRGRGRGSIAHLCIARAATAELAAVLFDTHSFFTSAERPAVRNGPIGLKQPWRSPADRPGSWRAAGTAFAAPPATVPGAAAMSEAEDEPLQRAALQRFGELLRARASALRREVVAHEDETAQMLERSRENVEDVADEAEARRGEEVRGAEALRDATELGDIEAALVRIDAGTYGDCLDCDTSIPLARLEANPSALRCIACQERFEASARRSAP